VLSERAGTLFELDLDGFFSRLWHSVRQLASRTVNENADLIRERIERETPWWIPSAVDEKIFKRVLGAILLTAALLATQPALAAGEEGDGAPRGPAVTVLKAAKYCFNNNVEVSGIMLARDETQVRPEKMGSKVSEIMADAGDVVTAGQILARIIPPEGGSINVSAPVAGGREHSFAMSAADSGRPIASPRSSRNCLNSGPVT